MSNFCPRLSVPESAEIANRHEQTVRRWIHAGLLPAADVNGRYEIERDDLYAFLGRSGPPSEAPKAALEVEACKSETSEFKSELVRIGALIGETLSKVPLDADQRNVISSAFAPALQGGGAR